MTVAYGQSSSQPSPKPTSQPVAPTKKGQALELYTQAKTCVSISGELCKVVGSLGAIAGGALMGLSVLSGNVGALVVSGGMTTVLAMAGAPIAAIGSMATSAKRQTKYAELDAWLKKENY
jgi:predicted phage tail protein